MKVSLLASVSVLVLSLTASADWVIESKVESPQMNMSLVSKVKGDLIRSDITGGPMGSMSSIVDTTKGESTQLMHAQKMVMKTSAAQLKQAMEMAKQLGGGKEGGTPKLEATGQKETVGGYECEIWNWSNGAASSKLWIAKNHPQGAALKDIAKKMQTAALGGANTGPDQAALPGPAIKTETAVMGMKTTMTILSVKEETVDAKEFEVPAGYQSMALPGAK